MMGSYNVPDPVTVVKQKVIKEMFFLISNLSLVPRFSRFVGLVAPAGGA